MILVGALGVKESCEFTDNNVFNSKLQLILIRNEFNMKVFWKIQEKGMFNYETIFWKRVVKIFKGKGRETTSFFESYEKGKKLQNIFQKGFETTSIMYPHSSFENLKYLIIVKSNLQA